MGITIGQKWPDSHKCVSFYESTESSKVRQNDSGLALFDEIPLEFVSLLEHELLDAAACGGQTPRQQTLRHGQRCDPVPCRRCLQGGDSICEDVKGEHSWKVGTADVHSSIVFREGSAPGG